MPTPKIPIIESVGLEFYLNATVDKHNDNTFADFVELISKQPRPTDVDVAAEFGVTSPTAAHWRAIYDKQAGAPMNS